jgi:hypothetical protein
VEIAMRLNPEVLDDAGQLRSAPIVHEADLFGDIPGPIWTAFLCSWGLLFALFVLFFSKDGPATLAVVTASFFALMTLGLPAALGLISKGPPRPWPRMIETHSGRLTVGAAATQILLIPVGGVIGVTAFIVLGM